MAKRKIIKIDLEKCTGCGDCIPNCPEGALQIIDGKARLVSDLFCDGLGACIGHCPESAITVEEREAVLYDEKKVMENIIKQGKNVIKAHLEHLREHKEEKYLAEAIDFLKTRSIEIPGEKSPHLHKDTPCGCPSAQVLDLKKTKGYKPERKHKSKPQLENWPVQIRLVPPFAPYLNNSDLLVAADCVPFAYADFHQDFLKDKVLLIGCPKLDDAEYYQQKIKDILKENNIKSVTCVHMEVPCCFGLVKLLKEAISLSGKKVPFKEVTISVKGEKL